MSTVQVAALSAAGKSAAGAIAPKVAALAQGVFANHVRDQAQSGIVVRVGGGAGVLALAGGAWLHRSQAESQSDRPTAFTEQERFADASSPQVREQERDTAKPLTGKLTLVDTGKKTITISYLVSRNDPPVERPCRWPRTQHRRGRVRRSNSAT